MLVPLFAALLVVWQGVVFSVPHDHADIAVPQEELACSASHPSSTTEHLHGSGRILSPHPCVACLVGSTAAETHGIVEIDTAPDICWIVAPEICDLRSSENARLPLLRGPPALV